MKKAGLTTWIIIAMAGGIATGLIIHYTAGPEWKVRFSDGMSILTDVFLRLIKMIIAPLVFSTLVTGIAKLGDIRAVGRIGGKTLLWFLGASLISLLMGLVIMNIVRLGSSLQLPVPEAGATEKLASSSLSFKNFITHVFPQSIVEAMATNEILQIVVFSIFFRNCHGGSRGKRQGHYTCPGCSGRNYSETDRVYYAFCPGGCICCRGGHPGNKRS
jgi:Na+/H+-dicarboxylate symporter